MRIKPWIFKLLNKDMSFNLLFQFFSLWVFFRPTRLRPNMCLMSCNVFLNFFSFCSFFSVVFSVLLFFQTFLVWLSSSGFQGAQIADRNSMLYETYFYFLFHFCLRPRLSWITPYSSKPSPFCCCIVPFSSVVFNSFSMFVLFYSFLIFWMVRSGLLRAEALAMA